MRSYITTGSTRTRNCCRNRSAKPSSLERCERYSTVRQLIHGLIDEVRLVPENGGLRIVLSGELAGILSLCDSKKKPASSYEERAEQIQMVAGAGFIQGPTMLKLRKAV